MKRAYSALFLISLFCLPVIPQAAEKNQLKNHPSPYLAMHGNDPVHWQTWNKEIFKRAKKENKLIFISIGYFACHWCHVMQRESYANAGIASIMNKDFIAVKIDKELNPALDAKLIEFVEKTRGHAGWPLNVFITPEGYPLIGVVYLPPEDFKGLLVNIAKSWKKDPQGLRKIAVDASKALEKNDPSLGSRLDLLAIQAYRETFIANAMQYADHLQGGFGEKNKFPLSPQLALLIQISKHSSDPSLSDFVKLTLKEMAEQGMYDQLRGGFFRYVVDPGWQIPHFEKMLYDNAQLAEIYLDAARVFGTPEYKKIAMATLDFLQNEFQDSRGGMISSLSAIDNKGVEGGYYLWQQADLKKYLTKEEYAVVTRYWSIREHPSLEAGNHLVIRKSLKFIAKELGQDIKRTRQLLASAKKKLIRQQLQRNLPHDTKVLAGWNGLALSAFAHAAINNPQYTKTAHRIRNRIVNTLWDGVSLHRAIANGKTLGNATLEDYAYVARGLYKWALLTGKDSDFQLVKRIVDQGWARFYTDKGWILSEDLMPGIAGRVSTVADGPMPSVSASLILVSLDIAKKLNDQKLMKLARSALNRGHESLATDNFWYATHLRAQLEALAGVSPNE